LEQIEVDDKEMALDLEARLHNKKHDLFVLQKQAALHGSLIPIVLANQLSEIEHEIEELENAISLLPRAEQIYLQRVVKADELNRWSSLFVPLSIDIPMPVSAGVNFAVGQDESDIFFRPEFASLDVEHFGVTSRVVRRRLEDLFEAVEQHKQFVLLGPPGSGKTTSLERLAWQMSIRRIDGQAKAKIPILLRLGDYTLDEGVVQWVSKTLRQQWESELLSRNLDRLLADGEVLLLFDALNQLPVKDYDKRIVQLKEFLGKLADGNRVVITCRVLDYEPDFGPQRVEILPLDAPRIRHLFELYLGTRRGEHLFQEVMKAKLLALAQIPYFALMISFVYLRNKTTLPRNQGRLLEAFITTLFDREARTKKDYWLPIDVQVAALSKIAFLTQLHLGSGVDIDVDWLVPRFPRYLVVRGKRWIIDLEVILRLAADANLLEITSDWKRFHFSHELIHEHFSGHELAKLVARHSEAHKFWQIPWFKSEMPSVKQSFTWRSPLPPPPPTGWEQATILTAGRDEDATTLVKRILKVNPLLAARCLIEGQAVVDEVVRKKIIYALLQLVSNHALSLRVRITAGDLLGELGDPRLNSTPMLHIRSGEFEMGNDGIDSFGNPIPRHRITTKAFLIAKYPVTYQEYAMFILAGGYDEQDWWASENGWAWKQKMQRRQPDFWEDPMFHRPNSPVVGVSWYEAMAYAHWAGKRLPTEAEWEKAASWDWKHHIQRTYTWGDTYDPNKLNINDGDEIAARTTPVGIYPDGISYSGVYDMLGNVWEWCSSIYSLYPYSAIDGRENTQVDANRIMRGGTFWSNPSFATCSSRFRQYQGYRFDIGGFRLAEDPPQRTTKSATGVESIIPYELE
jgi:formylglycine-generating enzyme required for sulfatase activity